MKRNYTIQHIIKTTIFSPWKKAIGQNVRWLVVSIGHNSIWVGQCPMSDRYFEPCMYKNNVKKTWNVINEVIGSTKANPNSLPKRLTVNNAGPYLEKNYWGEGGLRFNFMLLGLYFVSCRKNS